MVKLPLRITFQNFDCHFALRARPLGTNQSYVQCIGDDSFSFCVYFWNFFDLWVRNKFQCLISIWYIKPKPKPIKYFNFLIALLWKQKSISLRQTAQYLRRIVHKFTKQQKSSHRQCEMNRNANDFFIKKRCLATQGV